MSEAVLNVQDDLKDRAIQKLEGDKKELMQKVKNNTMVVHMAEYKTIDYLIERCKEDAGLCEDVLQEHKTYEKCTNYCIKKVENLITKKDGKVVVQVDDPQYYEWAEDYYHVDDKAAEEEKARKEKEREEKRKKQAEESRKKTEERKKKAVKEKKEPAKEKKEAPATPGKSGTKHDKKGEIEGQMSLFDLV